MQNIRLRFARITGLVLAAVMTSTMASGETINSNTWSDNFNDNDLDPFYVLNQRHTMTVINGKVKAVFYADQYINNRNSRSIEANAGVNATAKGIFKFSYLLPAAGTGGRYPRYPNNTNAGIGQVFQHGHACSSWAAIFTVNNNDLYLTHRDGCNSGTSVKLDDNIERSTWHVVRFEFDLSNNNTGYVKVEYNGSNVYEKTGINFGWADSWNSSDQQTNGSYCTSSFGQYNFDHSFYWATSEIWTNYYDNVTYKRFN